ncbi:MAG: hypothetical protein U0930_21235 [Pirellulales bacterium]
MISEAENRSSFTLIGLLGVTTYVAISLGLIVFTASTLGVHLLFILVGWIAWRYGHGRLAGIVPALIGLDLLTCSSFSLVTYGDEDFLGIRTLISAVCSILVFVGIGMLWIIAERRNRYWGNQIVILACLLVALIAWWSVIPNLGRATTARRQQVDISYNNEVTAKAIELIEEYLRAHGKTPDQNDVDQQLPEPLPSARWANHYSKIQYQKLDQSSYMLTYIDPASVFMGDIITYDSRTPEIGWYRVPF